MFFLTQSWLYFTTWRKWCSRFRPSRRTNLACRCRVGLGHRAASSLPRPWPACEPQHRSAFGWANVVEEAAIFEQSSFAATFWKSFQSLQPPDSQSSPTGESTSNWCLASSAPLRRWHHTWQPMLDTLDGVAGMCRADFPWLQPDSRVHTFWGSRCQHHNVPFFQSQFR